MKKQTGILLVGLAFALSSRVPVFASDSDDPVLKAVKAPVTLSALLSGVAVGTPIAVVRDSLNGYSLARDSVAESFGGSSPDACQYLVADFVAVPAGIATGLVNGTYHGVTNAVENCREKPFSAESFCLKDSCFDR